MMAVIQSGYPADSIMTIDSNPEVLAVCYAQGWCSSDRYMTATEAAAVKSIGSVFRYNTNITHFDEFRFFTGVTSIGNFAFQSSSFSSIIIPSSVTSLGSGSFMSSNLINVLIPSSVISIGASSFNNCSNLSSVKILATTPPSLGTNVFNRNASGRKIYVPSGSVNTYKTTSGWTSYASSIEEISD